MKTNPLAIQLKETFWRFVRRYQSVPAFGVQVLASRFVRFSSLRFGYLEALSFLDATDVWMRNALVARAVQRVIPSGGRILDVGSGLTGIYSFLPRRDFQVIRIDTRIRRIESYLGLVTNKLRADARALPFRDGAFDCVVAVDMIEHVPWELRTEVFGELGRVSRNWVMVHCPAESSDGRFVGRRDDFHLNEWYRARFGRNEPNTIEHIERTHPTIESLERGFPGAHVVGSQQSALWMRVLQESRVPFLGVTASLRLRERISRSTDAPPFHSCFLMWSKTGEA